MTDTSNLKRHMTILRTSDSNNKMKEQIVKVGQIWKHYKGGLYKITSLSKFEPDPTRFIVTYEPLHETGNDIPWSRFLDVFLEHVRVMKPDSDRLTTVNRFELIEDV